MKNINSGMLAALVAGPDSGVVPRRFVWLTGKDRASGTAASIGVWSGDETIDATVVSGTTGLLVARTYFGAGTLLSVSSIPRVSDLTIQTVTIDLSQIATAAQQAVRGYDLRLGKVEIHDMALDPVSRNPAGVGEIVFLGEIDGAPISTPAVGGEGSIRLKVRSDAISMLERSNPRKSSYEGQKRRQGDEWGKYSSTIDSWNVPWGQEKAK